MIRANLLPRTRRRVSAFGIDVELDHARRCIAGIALALSVGGAGAAIERVRIDRLEGEIASEERALEAAEPDRAAAARLARDVARYEAFERASAAFRRSGADAAIAVARVGNVLPNAVWLDALDRDAAGFALSGQSAGIDGIGATLARLALVAPPARAEIVSIDAHALDGSGIRFNVRLGVPQTSETLP